jgi:hypothetical protein
MPGSHRRAVNLGIRPGLQLRLPLVVIAITVAFAALFAAHTDAAYGRFVRIGIDQPGLKALVAYQGRDFLVVSLAMGTAYVLAILVACLVHGHRLLGPIVALRRHLEGMKNGDYSSSVVLRAGDVLSDVADDLNGLTAILRDQEKRSRTESPALPLPGHPVGD